MPGTAPDQLSHAEIRRAIEELTEHELIKIRAVAGALIYIGEISWSIDDLLQEAVIRLLNGQRNWRSDMALVPMLVGIMKSIASAENSSVKHQTEILESDLSPMNSDEFDDSPLDILNTDTSAVDEQIVNQKILNSLFEVISDDPFLRDILIGKVLGYERAELIAKLKVTSIEFDTANRQLKRKIEHFSKKIGEQQAWKKTN